MSTVDFINTLGVGSGFTIGGTVGIKFKVSKPIRLKRLIMRKRKPSQSYKKLEGNVSIWGPDSQVIKKVGVLKNIYAGEGQENVILEFDVNLQPGVIYTISEYTKGFNDTNIGSYYRIPFAGDTGIRGVTTTVDGVAFEITNWGYSPEDTFPGNVYKPNGGDISYLSSFSVEFESNQSPIVSLATTDNQTLYENDILAINGSATETDDGDVVTVKYSIDGGTARAIVANVSTGSAISFAKNLTYKSGKLYDGATAITDTLAEGSQHSLKVWAEDDKGGKSPEITRSFYVVPNRAATLSLDVFVTRTGLINTDVVNVSGKVADLDNGNVIVRYKIGNGAFVQVFNNTVGATPTPFNFNVLLADLADGDNQLTIQAVDAYNAITHQVLTIRKSKNEVPLLEAVTYYEITPPNGTADGLQLYVEREVGDLVIAADVFMGASGQSEVFVPMTLASTANLTNGNAEDTFSYEHGSDATKIVVRIKMTRSSGASNKVIKKISGVLT